jgi:hypothetical protein
MKINGWYKDLKMIHLIQILKIKIHVYFFLVDTRSKAAMMDKKNYLAEIRSILKSSFYCIWCL